MNLQMAFISHDYNKVITVPLKKTWKIYKTVVKIIYLKTLPPPPLLMATHFREIFLRFLDVNFFF